MVSKSGQSSGACLKIFGINIKEGQYFRLNVFYLHIDKETEIKKNEIATKLKKGTAVKWDYLQ